MRTRTDTDYRSFATTHSLVRYPTNELVTAVTTGTTCSRAWRCKDVHDSRFRSRQRLGEFTFNELEVATSRIDERAKYSVDFKLFHRSFDGSGPWEEHGGFRNSINPLSASVFLGPYSPLAELVHRDNPSETMRIRLKYQEVESVKAQTLTRLHAKLSDSEAMAAVSAAEAEKTVDMVHGAAQFFGSFAAKLSTQPKSVLNELRQMTADEMRALDKLNMRGANRRLAVACRLWLTARYGWMQLQHEIEGFVNASPNYRRMRRLTVSGSQSYSEAPTRVYAPQNDSRYPVNQTTIYNEDFSLSRSSRVVCGAMYKMNPFFAQIDALGGRRVFASAWELIPYSFVIDWFTNIGQVLSTVDSAMLCDVVGSWRTTTHTIMLTHSCNEGAAWTPSINWKAEGTYAKDAHRVDICQHIIREVNPSLPMLPQIQINMNPAKVIDALSLLSVNSKKLLALLRG